jgi:hypothetical protein
MQAADLLLVRVCGKPKGAKFGGISKRGLAGVWREGNIFILYVCDQKGLRLKVGQHFYFVRV